MPLPVALVVPELPLTMTVPLPFTGVVVAVAVTFTEPVPETSIPLPKLFMNWTAVPEVTLMLTTPAVTLRPLRLMAAVDEPAPLMTVAWPMVTVPLLTAMPWARVFWMVTWSTETVPVPDAEMALPEVPLPSRISGAVRLVLPLIPELLLERTNA